MGENREDPDVGQPGGDAEVSGGEIEFMWEPQPDVVRLAEDVLRRAKLGQLRSLGVIAELAGDGQDTMSAYTQGDRKLPGLCYANELLRMRLLTHKA